jgi:eukaryotic-like serine/threonine-protein kinase
MHSTTDDFSALQRALAGQYSIEREIGRGGMGIVYLAREVILDRPVAIKVLPATLAENPDSHDRFLREARTAAKLFHPHIVPIHRVDTVGDAVFIAMGFVDGQSAGQRVAEDGPMSIVEAVRVLRETAWALGYAHARGVIHRDVKPDNLLLERETGRTFVTDFGIAQVEGTSALTRDGQMFGSVSYMSPEQISGGTIDGRSDLYSLGIVAHVLLTGKLPFTHPSSTAVLAMQLGTPAPPIGTLVPGISPRLAAAIDKCLAKTPADRHENVDVFAAALADVERPPVIPPALRAWVAGTGLVDAGFWVLNGCAFLFVAMTGGGWPVFGIPFVYLAIQRSRQTRRLMQAGFGIEDIRAGLAAAIDRDAEETAAQVTARAPAIAKLLRIIARLSGWTFVVSLAAQVSLGALGFEWINTNLGQWFGTFVWYLERFFIYSALTWIGSRLLAELIAPSSPIGLKQREYRARLRFWTSKIGARFAKLLRKGLGRAGRNTRHDQPTELVLGAAAENLFEELPIALRRKLPELPSVVRALEERATALRVRIGELDRLATQVQPVRPAGVAAHAERADQLGVDLAGNRARAEERLGIAVAALETIRLDLLRMHAGNDAGAELTANVEAAAAVALEIDRLLEGQSDVSRMLASPRTSADRTTAAL